MAKHLAYNLTTGEILECGKGNQLKRHVAIVTNNDRQYGVRSEWIFSHKDINHIIAKANRIGKQRMGRQGDIGMNFRMAIVDECGEVVYWMDELTSEETAQALEDHPEWQMKPILI